VLVNPLSTNATDNPVYAPTLGDVINLMTAAGAAAATDLDNSGTVDGVDLNNVWRTAFVQSGNEGDADGDGDTDGADFLAWQQDVGVTGGGGVTGAFDSLVVDDPGNTMTNAGLAFQLQVTSSQVNLVVVAAGAVAAVPEPTAALLGAAAAVGLAAARRRRG
jgi:hypothetical protein